MKSLLKVAAVAAATLLAALPGHAVTVFSSSFESGAFNDTDPSAAVVAEKLALGSTDITGWTVTAGAANDAVTWIKEPSFGLTTPSGEYFLDLTSYQNSGRGAVSTTISTVAGWTYTVQFDLGSARNYNGATAAGIEVFAGANTLGNFTLVAPVGNNNIWATQTTASFVGTGSGMTLQFKGTSGVNYTGLDNVVVTAVPEPGALALMLAGMGVVGFMARRRTLKA